MFTDGVKAVFSALGQHCVSSMAVLWLDAPGRHGCVHPVGAVPSFEPVVGQCGAQSCKLYVVYWKPLSFHFRGLDCCCVFLFCWTRPLTFSWTCHSTDQIKVLVSGFVPNIPDCRWWVKVFHWFWVNKQCIKETQGFVIFRGYISVYIKSGRLEVQWDLKARAQWIWQCLSSFFLFPFRMWRQNKSHPSLRPSKYWHFFPSHTKT